MFDLIKPIAGAATFAGFILAASSGHASVVVENFVGLSGGDSSFDSQGFLYDPTKFTNGQCYDAVCLNEFNNNGDLTRITESSDLDNDDDGLFQLFGFYLNYNGSVAGDDFFKIFANDDATSSFTLGVSQTISDIYGLYDVTIFNEDGSSPLGTETLTFGSGGYFFIFDDDVFDNVSSITFQGLAQGGTLRLDCVALSHKGSGDSFSTQDISGFGGCSPEEFPPIPVPASLPLLVTGLALGGFVVRRRKSKA